MEREATVVPAFAFPADWAPDCPMIAAEVREELCSRGARVVGDPRYIDTLSDIVVTDQAGEIRVGPVTLYRFEYEVDGG